MVPQVRVVRVQQVPVASHAGLMSGEELLVAKGRGSGVEEQIVALQVVEKQATPLQAGQLQLSQTT